jgi:hypothetical protein
MIVKQISLEAENYLSLGKHSYGINLGNIAHAYFESVHCVGFDKGFYLEDSLINTFMRCRVNGNKYGVYIEGIDPFSGADGASKNCFIDLKATNNGDTTDLGAAILITGNSAYQNVFINADIEGNYLAIDIDIASNEGPNIFISPYFENTDANGGNGQNLVRCGTGKNLSMINPVFGTVVAGNTYFDLNEYDGVVDLTQASSNSQSTRIPPPKKGRMELTKDDEHNIASTNISRCYKIICLRAITINDWCFICINLVKHDWNHACVRSCLVLMRSVDIHITKADITQTVSIVKCAAHCLSGNFGCSIEVAVVKRMFFSHR